MENPNLPKKVLVIDDDDTVIESISNYLKKHGVAAARAHDVETALYLFNQQIFEVVVIELEFGPLPGLALVQKLRNNPHEERRQVGVVITSGQQRKTSDDNLVTELGDMELVTKPVNDIKLIPAIQRCVQKKRALKDYESIRSLCYTSLKGGNVNEAIELCKNNMPKLQIRGMALMAHLYEEGGKPAEALQVVDALLGKRPDDIAMLNAKGRLLLKTGEAGKAKEFLEKADKLAPQNIDRMRHMAAMYLQLHQPASATAKMKEVIGLSPEQPDLKFEMFRNLEHAGYMEEAIGLCRETTLPAEVVRFYNNKGVVLSKTGENKEALKEYTSALRFYPDFKENYRILFNVAIAEANQKSVENLKRAEAALLRCLELAPEFEKGAQLLAQVQRALLAMNAKAS